MSCNIIKYTHDNKKGPPIGSPFNSFSVNINYKPKLYANLSPMKELVCESADHPS